MSADGPKETGPATAVTVSAPADASLAVPKQAAAGASSALDGPKEEPLPRCVNCGNERGWFGPCQTCGADGPKESVVEQHTAEIEQRLADE